MKRNRHGMSKTRFYAIWLGMKKRCFYPTNQNFKWYGGRGITVCEQWNFDFINFKNDMYESYLEHAKIHGESNTSLDRKNSEGHYTKGNCRWATKKEQVLNSKNIKPFKAINPQGIVYLGNVQTEFAKEHGLDELVVNLCLKGKRKTHRKWKFEYLEAKK